MSSSNTAKKSRSTSMSSALDVAEEDEADGISGALRPLLPSSEDVAAAALSLSVALVLFTIVSISAAADSARVMPAAGPSSSSSPLFGKRCRMRFSRLYDMYCPRHSGMARSVSCLPNFICCRWVQRRWCARDAAPNE